jgi:hypothetical protein
MKKALVIVMVVMLCALQAFSQKGSTIWGEMFTGLVIKTDDVAREITLQSTGQDGTETFVGVLKDGYQKKLKDGSKREVKISEIRQGTRIRVYYKKISKEVNGQKVKTNLITNVVFLGRDEFATMRQFLKVAPDTPVTFVESKTLPETDPLRLKITGDNPVASDEIIKWAEEWNRREAKKYGRVGIVLDFEHADVTLVIHEGSDSPLSFTIPMISGFLVVEKPAGLEVIWKEDRLSLSQLFAVTNPAYEGRMPSVGTQITREIEKRLKFRHKAKRK